ncbi:MAG: hypothetical protein H7144_07260 [Burkholderiales bacterium]|nr:hypothetical protein [Phycisphaerae bacterium]
MRKGHIAERLKDLFNHKNGKDSLAIVGALAIFFVGFFKKYQATVYLDYNGGAKLEVRDWWGLTRKERTLKVLPGGYGTDEGVGWHLQDESGKWKAIPIEAD